MRSKSFAWTWRDPSHLEAHRSEFVRPIADVLEELRPLMPDARTTKRVVGDTQRDWVHIDFELSSETGESGLRRVAADGSESFWAYRRGRQILSHLCLGRRQLTRSVCIWGWWEDEQFVIHTLYPGAVAPREIHDPEIAATDLPAAIEFWRQHAIVTEEGEYSHQPDAT